MKIVHHAIIAGVGITGTIVIALFLVYIEPSLFSSSMTLDGIDWQYKAGDNIQPILRFSDQAQGCNTPRITLLNATNRSQVIYDVTARYHTCNNYFETQFYAGVNKNWIINQTQEYVIVGSVGTKSVEKEFLVYPNPEHMKFYTDIQVLGSDTYIAYQPMDFTVWVKAYGIVDGGEVPDVIIYDSNGSKIWETHVGLVLCCVPELDNINKKFKSADLGNQEGQINGPPVPEKAGQYTMTVSYNRKTIEEKFTVLPNSNPASPYYNRFAVAYKNGTYSGFIINYAITGGHNKILNATLDKKEKSLSLVLDVSNSGDLAVLLPSGLADLMEGEKRNTQVIVLENGKEIKYTQNQSNENLNLTIPFQRLTAGIEIIGTQKI